MDDVTIITNGQARDLLALCDLTPSEASDFDYITGEDTYSPRLFRYKGAVYDANEFMRANGESAPSHRPFAAWHGATGLVVRENNWGPTTGKHLNAIDGGDKKARLSADAFEAKYRETFA